jgi:hypothetical protein
MHRHGVGLSAEAIVLTTVAVSERVPATTVMAWLVVVRATEQRTPTPIGKQYSITEFTIIAASGSRRRNAGRPGLRSFSRDWDFDSTGARLAGALASP